MQLLQHKQQLQVAHTQCIYLPPFVLPCLPWHLLLLADLL